MPRRSASRRWAAHQESPMPAPATGPMGGGPVVTYAGDRHMAQAAHATGIPFVLSGNSITPMEKLARVCPGAWFASYQPPDFPAVERMVRRVADAGFAVFAMTVDVPVES